MKKEFIPYEQALALKELGFEEECFGKYYYVREHEVYDPRKGEDFMFGDNNRILLKDNPCNYGYDSNEVTVCVAPLYQQSFRWFRDKYSLYFEIRAFAWDYDKKLLGFSIKTYLNPVEIETERVFQEGVYETYEEAELECLKKLIEIAQK